MDSHTLSFIQKVSLALLASSSLLWAGEEPISADTPAATVGSEVAVKTSEVAKKPGEAEFREALGFLIMNQAGLQSLAFTKQEMEDVLTGARKAALGLPCPIDVVKDRPDCEKYWRMKEEAEQKKQLEANQKVATTNKEKANEYLKDLKAKNSENPNFKVFPSGLICEMLVTTDAPKIQAKDDVLIHYKGTLVDGTEFDSSLRAGKPTLMKLEKLIEGFKEGLQLMGKGEKAKLYIPSDLGYGDQPPSVIPIPPGALLIFELEIIDVMKPATSTAVAVRTEDIKSTSPATTSTAVAVRPEDMKSTSPAADQ